MNDTGKAVAKTPDTARFELGLEIRDDMVTTIRQFIENLYTRVFDDEDLAYRVGLTVHELLENAIKNSIVDQVTVSIELSDGIIDICTRNRASTRDITLLKQIIAEMDAESDAFEYYQRLMHRWARLQKVSGLGLGRIWAEADMSLSCRTESDTVYIHAQTSIPGR